jgi:hypothetical protein
VVLDGHVVLLVCRDADVPQRNGFDSSRCKQLLRLLNYKEAGRFTSGIGPVPAVSLCGRLDRASIRCNWHNLSVSSRTALSATRKQSVTQR